ncbi:protein phosphatase, partial [Streptomyces sp. T-3]|nr:protein phosphatase [Streptomyces sp. T-3]
PPREFGPPPAMEPTGPPAPWPSPPPAYSAEPTPDEPAIDERPVGGRRRWVVRTLIAVTALAVLSAGALFAAYQLTRDSYFVGARGGHVALYRGVDVQVGWIDFGMLERDHPEIELTYLPAYQRLQLENTIAQGSLAGARAKVDDLASQASVCKKKAELDAAAAEGQEGSDSPQGPTLTEDEERLADSCPTLPK